MIKKLIMRLETIWTGKDGGGNQLMLGAVVALMLVSVGILKILLEPQPSPKTTQEIKSEGIISAEEHVSTIKRVRGKLDAEKRQKALAAIEEHEAAINLNWKTDDIPDRLMAIGNLNQYQLGEYYSAIQSYRSLIESYPSHSKVAQAYIEMATCYERLGDETQARYVYDEMVQSLDPSLEHVRYAKLKLEGEPAF